MPSEIKINSSPPEHPIHYRYPPLLRGFMVFSASLVCLYSLYFLIKVVDVKTPLFFKLLPLVIMFVAFDSVLRHLTSLNCVTFFEDRIRFSYIIKPNVQIKYTDILFMELKKHITYTVQIRYRDDAGVEKLFTTPASFPKTLEIMLIIADLSPNIKLSEKLSNVVEHLHNKAD
jgi:hypothetical protein